MNLLILVLLVLHKIVFTSSYDVKNGFFDGFKNIKETALGELQAEVPPDEKDGVYYFVISLFVFSTFCSTILTGAFLILSVVLWSHFKPMKFFWFLSQLTLTVFIMCSLNFFINVPATLFSLITTEFVQSSVFMIMSHIIDFCHNTILFSNLAISIQRFIVFFFNRLNATVFEKPYMYIWLSLVWILSAFIVLFMMFNGCMYQYEKGPSEHYVLMCSQTGIVNTGPPAFVQFLEIVVQIVVPIVILSLYISIIVKIFLMKKSALSAYELLIMKQAFAIFILFQISSIFFLLAQSLKFGLGTAFIIKRVINTTEILAGAATPCFFFFTSKEIRKLISARVSAASSQGNSNTQNQRRTIRSL